MSGKSPAQLFFGRRLRGILPHLPGANDLDIDNAISGANNRKSLMQKTESNPGTPLKKLHVNQRILVQHPITKKWENKGKITGIRSKGRSYEILLDSGKKYIRNRAFLRPISEFQQPNTEVPITPEITAKPRRSARLAQTKNN